MPHHRLLWTASNDRVWEEVVVMVLPQGLLPEVYSVDMLLTPSSSAIKVRLGLHDNSQEHRKKQLGPVKAASASMAVTTVTVLVRGAARRGWPHPLHVTPDV